MTETSFISAEQLRTHMVTRWTREGRSDPEPMTDLRGSPIGDKAQVWEFDRLVLPRPRATRRVRQRIKVMHCPEGWHSTSGTADSPSGPELCSTMAEWWQKADWRDKFRQFHEDNPVVWVVQVSQHTRSHTYRYCDPELPAEYRPGPVLTEQPCGQVVTSARPPGRQNPSTRKGRP